MLRDFVPRIWKFPALSVPTSIAECRGNERLEWGRVFRKGTKVSAHVLSLQFPWGRFSPPANHLHISPFSNKPTQRAGKRHHRYIGPTTSVHTLATMPPLISFILRCLSIYFFRRFYFVKFSLIRAETALLPAPSRMDLP